MTEKPQPGPPSLWRCRECQDYFTSPRRTCDGCNVKVDRYDLRVTKRSVLKPDPRNNRKGR